ncbi:hypothetical protein QE450_003374 [Paenibacillus sp. SORGH_AS306]|nr:hypothetical protein [Paenibacillus sp. SORGH_AS_0306]MDR6112926.1 hypothetical protein [Paenibacillus sp. SORGH_AS_0338]
MMSATDHIQIHLQKLEEITTNVVSRISIISEEELLDFVNEREVIIAEMQAHREYITDTERQVIQKLLDCDPLIMQKLNYFKDEAGHWLEKQGNIRNQHTAYHQNFVNDSFFIDRLK